jgi:hypothetical protein
MFLVCCSQQTRQEEMPMQPNGAPPHYRFGVCVRAACLSAALLALFGCVAGEHKQPAAEPPASPSQPLPATPLESPHKSEQAEIQETALELPGSGQTPWASGFEGELIMGLDGQLYDAYNAETIKHVQTLMTNRGLYSGPINGVLDPPTMESLLSFQEASHSLLQCGVPTPRTRKMLEQGSHTDVAVMMHGRRTTLPLSASPTVEFGDAVQEGLL